jgi:hypothetical protein
LHNHVVAAPGVFHKRHPARVEGAVHAALGQRHTQLVQDTHSMNSRLDNQPRRERGQVDRERRHRRN